MSTRTLIVNGDTLTGTPKRYRLADLKKSNAYQRKTDIAKAIERLNPWQDDLAEFHVADDGDGSGAGVVGGWHTVNVAIHYGLTELEGVEWTGFRHPKTKAHLVNLLNKTANPTTVTSELFDRVEMGCEDEVRFAGIVDSAGCKRSPALFRLMTSHKNGPVYLTAALQLGAELWGGAPGSFEAGVVGGLFQLVGRIIDACDGDEVNWAVAAKAIKLFNVDKPSDLKRASKDVGKHGGSRPAFISNILFEAWRSGRSR